MRGSPVLIFRAGILATLGIGIFMALNKNFTGLLIAALSVVGFFLSQKIGGALIGFDKWSILLGGLLLFNIVQLIFFKLNSC